MNRLDVVKRQNAKLLLLTPDFIEFNGAEYPCIAPPLDVFNAINPSTYDAKVTFVFEILESDRTAAGMVLQSTIEFETPYAVQFKKTKLAFQVKHFNTDKNDSMVRLVCNLKQ